MALFRRKSPAGAKRPIESGVSAVVGWQGSRWLALVDLALSDPPVVADDPRLGDLISTTLADAAIRLRAGAADSTDALERLLAAEGETDVAAALAAGWRIYTLALGRQGLTINRMALTAEAPSFTTKLVPAGSDAASRFQHSDLADWPARFEANGWGELPIWSEAARWLIAGRESDPRAGAWWDPDPTNPGTPFAPLRESQRSSTVTRFLNGTEDFPDPAGPAAIGWADPGATGRWLAFYHWDPFGTGDPFRSMVGLVADPDAGTVRCFHWADRATVRPIAVRGRQRWSTKDARLVQGLVRELMTSADVPASWETAGPEPGEPGPGVR